MTPEDRAHVVAVARSWVRTPFHDGARLKGVGVDCAQLIAAVYVEAGLVAEAKIKPYSPQWMLHRDQPLFEEHLKAFGAHEVTAPQIGDIVLYRVGRSFAHGGIIATAWPGAIIHAFKTYGFVAETGCDEADLRDVQRKFYSLG